MNRGAWQATVLGAAESVTTEWLSQHRKFKKCNLMISDTCRLQSYKHNMLVNTSITSYCMCWQILFCHLADITSLDPFVYWSIVNLQHFASFRYTVKWFSYNSFLITSYLKRLWKVTFHCKLRIQADGNFAVFHMSLPGYPSDCIQFCQPEG